MAETAGAALAAELGFAVMILAFFVVPSFMEDRDDARLDQLREAAVHACDDRTESVQSLDECVANTIRATGQKP